MKRELKLMCLLLTLGLAACERDTPKKSGHQISIELGWADSSDQEIEAKDFYFWVFQANGQLVKEHHYTKEQQVVLNLYTTETGEHKVLSATNLIFPFSVSATTSYENLVFKLDRPSASPEHAYFGVATVNTSQGKKTAAPFSMRRVMSEIKIEIEGAPQGTTLAAYVNNAADGIYPLQKDHEGNFGRATSGNKNIVSIPKALAINGTISTDNMRLMPTVAEATKANSANSNLSFLFTLSDGTIIECNAQAPIMRSSGKYKIKMKYSQLKPYMLLEPIKINDWEEGWTISGEIPNPENKNS